MTDNALNYRRSTAFRTALSSGGARHLRTRPYRPQSNGKAERLNQTLLREWAYDRPYVSNRVRLDSLTDWLHDYDWHRLHTRRHSSQSTTSRQPLCEGQLAEEMTTSAARSADSKDNSRSWRRNPTRPLAPNNSPQSPRPNCKTLEDMAAGLGLLDIRVETTADGYEISGSIPLVVHETGGKIPTEVPRDPCQEFALLPFNLDTPLRRPRST